jgi:hypothetical protein
MKCAERWGRRCVGFVLLSLAIWAAPSVASAASDDEMLRNVALVLIPREILFFSAQAGQWTSVRLEAGERVLERGADGNVAAVVTSQRAVGFSAVLNVAQEFRVSNDENLETFKVEGNMANFVTRRRAYGFSAFTGTWATIDRFQLGK